jgi:hypothetical protein
MTKENQLLDIESFNSVADCEKGSEMELMKADGMTGEGVFLMVLGAQSDIVLQHTKANTKRVIAGRNIAEKQKKETEFTDRLIDASDTKAINDAAILVTGWRGVKQDYSTELLKVVLKRNPHWIDQINKFSETIANFTMKPVQS